MAGQRPGVRPRFEAPAVVGACFARESGVVQARAVVAPAEREVASLSETLFFRGLVGGRRSGLPRSYAVMLEQEDQTMVYGRASANADRFLEGELQETA